MFGLLHIHMYIYRVMVKIRKSHAMTGHVRINIFIPLPGFELRLCLIPLTIILRPLFSLA